MTDWKWEYLLNGGPGERQFAGWYATQHTKLDEIPPGHGMLSSFCGPFKTEAEAKAYCDRENGKEERLRVRDGELFIDPETGLAVDPLELDQ